VTGSERRLDKNPGRLLIPQYRVHLEQRDLCNASSITMGGDQRSTSTFPFSAQGFQLSLHVASGGTLSQATVVPSILRVPGLPGSKRRPATDRVVPLHQRLAPLKTSLLTACLKRSFVLRLRGFPHWPQAFNSPPPSVSSVYGTPPPIHGLSSERTPDLHCFYFVCQ